MSYEPPLNMTPGFHEQSPPVPPILQTSTGLSRQLPLHNMSNRSQGAVQYYTENMGYQSGSGIQGASQNMGNWWYNDAEDLSQVMANQHHFVSPSATGFPSPLAATSASTRNGGLPRIPCPDPGCNGMTFRSKRELKRHRQTAKIHWRNEAKLYWCRCNRTSNRKDNFERHAKACNKGSGAFACICDRQFGAWNDIKAHFEECRLHRLRRQRGASTAS